MNSDMVTPAGSLCPSIGLTPAAVTNPTVHVLSPVYFTHCLLQYVYSVSAYIFTNYYFQWIPKTVVLNDRPKLLHESCVVHKLDT